MRDELVKSHQLEWISFEYIYIYIYMVFFKFYGFKRTLEFITSKISGKMLRHISLSQLNLRYTQLLGEANGRGGHDKKKYQHLR